MTSTTSGTTLTTTAVADADEAWLRPTAVLFDLDGTITDSGGAVTRSIAEALAHFGYPEQTQEELLRFVGPPTRIGFREFAGVAPEQLDEVIAWYRAAYLTRMLDVNLYPGVPELVRALHAAGVPLAIATSKMRHLAVEILEHDGLAQYFTVICGATRDESRSAKADIVEDALTGLREAGVDVSGAVMIGDRHHDVDGATTHGVPAVLVRWGYGRPGEEDGAVATVDDAAELAALLGVTLP
ncbi:HAD hydrolase-like protein [Georgenia sp. SYP-B2076]|uniref:HAD hydrolase-like protein n=1 Tax=Georgenia sp. SYP-B2076 TaxID=2495881 RepID=UPI000F8D9521|nr:HAD hydrolase-like protein [Georgenia sp. SYP-B2076]